MLLAMMYFFKPSLRAIFSPTKEKFIALVLVGFPGLPNALLAAGSVAATIPKNANQTITVTGTVTPTQYGNAIARNFADTVTVSPSP